MAYVTPRVWVVSESITAAKMNEISSTLNFLASPPACKAYKTSAPSIATGTFTTLSFEQNRFDNAAIHTAGSSNFVAVVAGVWDLRLNFEFANSTVGSRGAQALVGATVVGVVMQPAVNLGASSGAMTMAPPPVKLNLGDVVTFQVFQDSGAGLAVRQVTDYSTTAGMGWRGFGV